MTKRFLFSIMSLLTLLLLAACNGDTTQVTDAPPFTLQNAADGSEVSLADYSGRPVLLYFHMAVG
jgi:cytochrome oxidase Cu insertion factor (SCO1/SenC/PrrC family)